MGSTGLETFVWQTTSVRLSIKYTVIISSLILKEITLNSIILVLSLKIPLCFLFLQNIPLNSFIFSNGAIMTYNMPYHLKIAE